MNFAGAVFLSFTIFTARLAAQDPSDNRRREAAPAEKDAIAVDLDPDGASADMLANEITDLLGRARGPLPMEEFVATHTQIAKRIHAFRTKHPSDDRAAAILPKRWLSLAYLSNTSLNAKIRAAAKAKLIAEIDDVLATTRNSTLRRDAFFYRAVFAIDEATDGPAAAELAEAFVREWPNDNRSAEVLQRAAMKFTSTPEIPRRAPWALIIFLVVVGLLAALPNFKIPIDAGKWRRRAGLFAILSCLVFAVVFRLIPERGREKTVAWIGSRSEHLAAMANVAATDLSRVVLTRRFGFDLALAGGFALTLIVGRKFWPLAFRRRISAIRLSVLGFSLFLAFCVAADAHVARCQKEDLMERIARNYPDSFRGHLARGKTRQREQIGHPFELDFVDAISGRAVSVQQLRGKVVVVEFWATWCGPCVAEMAVMKKLYAQYHNRGVEFIGVSHDLPEDAGGLDALKAFVARERIPWPQYYQGHDDGRAVETGAAVNDFSESWGIDGIPTVFLIDASGRLYSCDARGKLGVLLPQLLDDVKR